MYKAEGVERVREKRKTSTRFLLPETGRRRLQGRVCWGTQAEAGSGLRNFVREFLSEHCTGLGAHLVSEPTPSFKGGIFLVRLYSSLPSPTAKKSQISLPSIVASFHLWVKLLRKKGVLLYAVREGLGLKINITLILNFKDKCKKNSKLRKCAHQNQWSFRNSLVVHHKNYWPLGCACNAKIKIFWSVFKLCVSECFDDTYFVQCFYYKF